MKQRRMFKKRITLSKCMKPLGCVMCLPGSAPVAGLFKSFSFVSSRDSSYTVSLPGAWFLFTLRSDAEAQLNLSFIHERNSLWFFLRVRKFFLSSVSLRRSFLLYVLINFFVLSLCAQLHLIWKAIKDECRIFLFFHLWGRQMWVREREWKLFGTWFGMSLVTLCRVLVLMFCWFFPSERRTIVMMSWGRE